MNSAGGKKWLSKQRKNRNKSFIRGKVNEMNKRLK